MFNNQKQDKSGAQIPVLALTSYRSLVKFFSFNFLQVTLSKMRIKLQKFTSWEEMYV